ncbi:MAG: pantoate--beta-alanine ligase [Glaciecola sp.]|jgi:pantoate--beta-alanine ligase
MQTIANIKQLREVRREWQLTGQRIAFVPTMGNLHAGHLSLVAQAKQHADIVVVSIFVNPLQFGAEEDLDNYPRTLSEDAAQLEALGVDILFTPEVQDIYPRGLEQQTFVEVPGISYMICGASRPGHFRGVATIVSKLFNMVQPNIAFFGEKDYQQLQVIKAMVTDLSMNVEIVGVPTMRHEDGLAMSSRNGYLSAEERAIAPTLGQVLNHIKTEIEAGNRSFKELIESGTQTLADAGFKPDYIEIREAFTLQPAGFEDNELVVLGAAFLGKTRLIDNLQITL